MYKFSVRGKDVTVDLEPGVYVFDCVTSSGKTFLCNALKTFKRLGQPVAGYTYNDMLDGIDLDKYVGNEKLECLVVDRYDMYMNKYIDTIERLADDGCVVLVDCKYKALLKLDYELASIELGAGKVRVY